MTVNKIRRNNKYEKSYDLIITGRNAREWASQSVTSETPLAFYDLGRIPHDAPVLKYYGYLVRCLL